jgi:hypothetical protein
MVLLLAACWAACASDIWVEGMPSGELNPTVGLGWGGFAMRISVGVPACWDSPVSLGFLLVSMTGCAEDDLLQAIAYLSSSLALAALARLRLGTGMRHSIEKATQFVHGTLLTVNIQRSTPAQPKSVLTLEKQHRIGPIPHKIRRRSHARNCDKLCLVTYFAGMACFCKEDISAMI